MKEKDCVFCKIMDREITSKIIFENDLTLAFLDISPISKGHTIVIPKNHYSNLEDIPDYELTELYKVVKNLAKRIHKNIEIDGYNILQNNFIAAGQVIKHFHVHIIPRKFDDKKFQIKIPRVQASEEELEEAYEILKS
ncbi:MAG: HIT family protein [Promethearchaeota archaeon]